MRTSTSTKKTIERATTSYLSIMLKILQGTVVSQRVTQCVWVETEIWEDLANWEGWHRNFAANELEILDAFSVWNLKIHPNNASV